MGQEGGEARNLRMRCNIEVEPLCAGMCSVLQMFLRSAMSCSTASGKSLGCGDVNLILMFGAAADTASNRSTNLAPPPPLSLYVLEKPAADS